MLWCVHGAHFLIVGKSTGKVCFFLTPLILSLPTQPLWGLTVPLGCGTRCWNTGSPLCCQEGHSPAAASLPLDAAVQVGAEGMLWMFLCSWAVLSGTCPALCISRQPAFSKGHGRRDTGSRQRDWAMLMGCQKIGSIQDSGESHKLLTFSPGEGSKINSHGL